MTIMERIAKLAVEIAEALEDLRWSDPDDAPFKARRLAELRREKAELEAQLSA
jgi:hypothetical protein